VSLREVRRLSFCTNEEVMNIASLLKIEHPIIQGAMAEIALPQLVAAVSNAGALGVLASGGWSSKKLRENIRICRSMTDKPFAVNLMLMMTNIHELVEVVIEEKVAVVTTGAGTPKNYMPRLKEAGVIVIPVVPSARLAKKMEDIGADAVVAEGMESGGHVGEITTMALIPQTVDAVSIPVIAAGGVADARGVVAAFALGAKGVQMGTRFVTTVESPVHPNFKQAIIAAGDSDTVVTGRGKGVPVRCLRNDMTAQYVRMEADPNVTLDELEHLTLGSLRRAATEGDVQSGSVMAGQISGLIDELVTCRELVSSIMADARKLAGGLSID